MPPTSRGAPFPPASSRGGILYLRGRERIPGIPVTSQEEALSTGKARGTPVSCHIPKVPQMSQSIPGKPVFAALPRLSSRGSTHTTVARGTSLWASLVRKPRGKASRERHRSLDPCEGKRDTAATAREEARESHPYPEEPRFRLLDREQGSLTCAVGKEFPAFPSHLKRERSPQERREVLQGRATIPRSPRCLSPFHGSLFSRH